MIKFSKSWWGIKESGDDITQQIIDIINNASAFIIVGGYNFTFKTSVGARSFFDALRARLQSGIKVLMLFPPHLHSKYNPQHAIINYCLTNGIAIILNHQNHSKWLLTDSQIYYGSSNFTQASWRDRVEVVSLHDHNRIFSSWSRQTIKDFKEFLENEIADLNAPRRHVKDYRGLLTATRIAWRSIQPLIQKLNPSINKVIQTLSNYDSIQAILKEQIVYWFDYYNEDYFKQIVTLSIDISESIDNLCEFAYANIYNETVQDNSNDLTSEIINEYNSFYKKAIETINFSIDKLNSIDVEVSIQLSINYKNLEVIREIYQLIKHYLKTDE